MNLKPKYSGPNSKKFWDEIDSLKSTKKWEQAYALGIVLQNVEADILRLLKQL